MSKVVLIYDWAMKADEFKACVTAIEKLQNVRAVAVSNYWLEMGWALPENHNAQSNLIQNFWDKFNCSLNCYNDQHAEIFANRHLTFQFKRIKDEMENAIAYGDIFAVLLDILKPSAIIFAHEAFTLEKMLVGLSKKKGIPTASLFHGGLGPRVGFQGLCGDSDEILVWNNYDIDCLVAFGVDRARIKKIGCVRYEDEYKQYKHHPNPYGHRTKAKAFIGLDKNKPLITLLTAQINTGFAALCADPGKHREAIRHYISFVQSRPDLQFVIKAHPGYDYNELYSILLDHNLPNLFYDAGLKLDDVLKASDICFMLNYFTSAAIEAMLNRVPVIFLDDGIYPLRDWQDSLTDTNITRVSSFLELESKINDLLTSPEFKANTLLEADEILKNILGIEERSATDQLGLAINSMLDKKNDVEVEVEFDGLSSREFLQYFLQSNDSQLAIKSSNFFQMHNSRNIMYVLSYLCGAYSLSHFNVFRIFKQVKQMPIDLTWRDVKWHLFQSYILGIFNRSEQLRVIDIVRILLICIFNPIGFISAPGSFKSIVGKRLIRQLVGKNFLGYMLNLIRRFSPD